VSALASARPCVGADVDTANSRVRQEHSHPYRLGLLPDSQCIFLVQTNVAVLAYTFYLKCYAAAQMRVRTKKGARPFYTQPQCAPATSKRRRCDDVRSSDCCHQIKRQFSSRLKGVGWCVPADPRTRRDKKRRRRQGEALESARLDGHLAYSVTAPIHPSRGLTSDAAATCLKRAVSSLAKRSVKVALVTTSTRWHSGQHPL
jgi:hypothetical protein